MTQQNRPDSADPLVRRQAPPGSRMFPELETLDVDESFRRRIGLAGGICDGSDHADAEPDTAREAAGWPFFGQFVMHDLVTQLMRLMEMRTLGRCISHRLNLESLYGSGPVGSPYFYDADQPAKLLVGDNDLPRNAKGTAIIGVPQNDSNRVVSQLHLLFLRFHNAVVDWLSARTPSPTHGHTEPVDMVGSELAAAQQHVRWHYHWIILHDFLPRVIGRSLAEELLERGPRYFDRAKSAQFIPVEFLAGVARYGHGQIRNSYRINSTTTAPLFPDLAGNCPLDPAHIVDWSYLFDLDGRPPAQRARPFDGRLPRSLYQLPAVTLGPEADGRRPGAPHRSEDDWRRALAYRDLLAGHFRGLPSGEAVARHLGVEPLTREETGLAGSGWEGETPLWYYVLREAAARGNGDELGPVGGRILGEVLVAVIDHEPTSFRVADRAWRPVLPSRIPGEFTLADLITFVETNSAHSGCSPDSSRIGGDVGAV